MQKGLHNSVWGDHFEKKNTQDILLNQKNIFNITALLQLHYSNFLFTEVKALNRWKNSSEVFFPLRNKRESTNAVNELSTESKIVKLWEDSRPEKNNFILSWNLKNKKEM